VVVRRVRGGARWGGAVLALGLAWFAASALRVWFAGVTGASLPWLFALPSTAIVLGATLVERSRPWLAGRAVRWAVALGDASYVLYLIHLLVFDALYQCLRTMHALGWLPAPLVVSALLAGSLVAGLAVHRFVELPVTAAVRRWLGGERTRAPRDRRLLEELA